MTSLEIERLRKKLDILRRLDKSFETFGSASHRYQARPPISIAELRDFEASHKISLPSSYRTFISEFSNGGPGPDYGLFPLGYFDAAGGPLERWAERDGFAGVLAKPFPHVGPWNHPEDRISFDGPFESEEAEDAWIRDYEQDTWNPDLMDGAFPISHQGCAIRTVLVVTGPERGNVWIDDRANDGGIFPATSNTPQRLSFVDWYTEWLDKSIARLRG